MIKRITILLVVAVIFSACHHRLKTRVEDPQEYGKDQYVIYYQSKKSPTQAKAAAVKKANAYCQKNNGQMVVISNSETEQYHYEFIFSCKATDGKAATAGGSKQTKKSKDSEETEESEESDD